MLKFHLVTDTHLYDYKVFGLTERRDQVTLNESGPIIDAAFEQIIADKSTDILLVAGDLTNIGEKACHESMVQKFRHLQANGVRVFPITATHDYGAFQREGYDDDNRNTRDELRALYNDFGFAQAYAVYDLSYAVQLAPGYRLLALNDDSEDICGYDDDHLDWIFAQIREAKAAGDFIFAMTHHPTMAPSPAYPIIGGEGNMLRNHDEVTTRFADAGLHFIFTGHTHMHNIAHKITEQGNHFYDINTGALVGCPAAIREIVVDGNRMQVDTIYVEDFDWDLGGRSVRQYTCDHFDKMLNSIFDAFATDIPRFADILAGEFSVPKDTIIKLKFPLKIVGKIVDKITLGGLGRLLFCAGKVPKAAKKVRLRHLIVEVVRNLYLGDEPYSRETPIGAAAYAIIARLESLAKPILKKVDLPFDSLPEFVLTLMYDPTPDAKAVLEF